MVFIKTLARAAAILSLAAATAGALDLDTIGVTTLRNTDPSLTGAGVQVAQPEDPDAGLAFEVAPSDVGAPAGLFTYRSNAGRAVTFPNSIGQKSDHANEVAANFYGAGGVAPHVAHVYNYQSSYFFEAAISLRVPIRALIVNQSFIVNSDATTSDRRYDDYISRYRRIVVSAAGNGGAIIVPATCFNGIAVGAYNGNTSSGPTADGRSKPDLVAPADFTSFSAPQVAGAAALLVQAGRRQGANARAAIDPRTIKALLMNGATKTGGWSHTQTQPLDQTLGAGLLNVFRSYEQLIGRRHGPSFRESAAFASVYASKNLTPTIQAPLGWDFRAAVSSATRDGITHYSFDFGGGAFAATLAWSRHSGASAINNLDLFLWDANTGTLVASSVSTVDNIEHLFVSNLPASRYDLQVVKRGGGGQLTGAAENYALAWSFGQ